jgi:hypothetical protein
MIRLRFRLVRSARSRFHPCLGAKSLLVLALLSSTLAPAQENANKNANANANANSNTKSVIWANAINLGSSVLNASAEHFGARQCLNEGDKRIAALHGRFQRTLAISVPIDTAIGFVSWKLRRKHPGLAVWLPATSAGLQTGFAAIQYVQGCY